MNEVLVATDGSPSSMKGIEHAVQAAKEKNVDLIALFVDTTGIDSGQYAISELPRKDRLGLKSIDVADIDITSILEKHYDQVEKSETLIHGEAGLEVAEFLAEKQGVKAKIMIERGSIVETIIEVAARENVNMIVIGSKGLTGLRKILLGSVAERVTKSAPCPVLIVR